MKLTCIGLLIFFQCQDAAPTPPAVVCPPVPQWSADYQKRLRDEFAALPKDAAARQAIREAIQMRKRARACRGR
jgi:hypothetical protein